MTLMPLRVAVDEAARLLGISRPTVFRRIQRGEIAVVKDGRRTLITTAELERYAALPSLPLSNPPNSDKAARRLNTTEVQETPASGANEKAKP